MFWTFRCSLSCCSQVFRNPVWCLCRFHVCVLQSSIYSAVEHVFNSLSSILRCSIIVYKSPRLVPSHSSWHLPLLLNLLQLSAWCSSQEQTVQVAFKDFVTVDLCAVVGRAATECNQSTSRFIPLKLTKKVWLRIIKRIKSAKFELAASGLRSKKSSPLTSHSTVFQVACDINICNVTHHHHPPLPDQQPWRQWIVSLGLPASCHFHPIRQCKLEHGRTKFILSSPPAALRQRRTCTAGFLVTALQNKDLLLPPVGLYSMTSAVPRCSDLQPISPRTEFLKYQFNSSLQSFKSTVATCLKHCSLFHPCELPTASCRLATTLLRFIHITLSFILTTAELELKMLLKFSWSCKASL